MNYEVKIKSFTDLNVWKESYRLVLIVYKLTKNFPKEEIFGLSNQLKRAVVSITSNIAEGFSRISYKEKVQFYCISLGSLTEVQSQLFIAKDIDYISKGEFNKIYELTIVISKLLNSIIKKSKTIIQNS